jgi:phosphoribosylformimino-5-aminoimidazole carboxamide ribotide isomerase
VALDARDGFVTTHGWQAASPWRPTDLGRVMAGMGVCYALYTDIDRDGELAGVNVEATARLARLTGLAVIASGGVASLDDVRALCAVEPPLAGVVIGTALYNGALDLRDAIDMANRSRRKGEPDAG